MIKHWRKTSVLVLILTECNPFGGQRKIDWKKEWKDNGSELKKLTHEIKENREGKYRIGNNSFPNSFSYLFDHGFYIWYGSRDTLIDTNRISIRYYVDRVLLDHFSALIYTKDTSEINELEIKVQQGGNDHEIEENWYMVNG